MSPHVLLEEYPCTEEEIKALMRHKCRKRSYKTSQITWSTLSTETISFSVSAKLVRKLLNKDTTGAAYDKAKPTYSTRDVMESKLIWKK